MNITFFGATKGVTGACFLIDFANKKLLVDCGLFQGSHELSDKNWEPFGFDPAGIDYLFLTHGHLDHCGQIPKLVRHGFNGRIISTDATRDIAELIMYDAYKIQEEDYRRGRLKYKSGEPKELLYSEEDISKAVSLFDVYEYSKSVKLIPELEFRMRNAGHILGSSIFEFWIKENGKPTKIVFSGDLGQPGKRIVWDPDNVREADYVVVESTYGDRLHKDKNQSILEFLSIIRKIEGSGGNVIIPVFAVERTQEILYEINLMSENGLLGDIGVYLDSPLATKVTELFKKYQKYYDTDALRLVEGGDDPFEFKGFKMITGVEESKKLSDRTGVVILAGSGMCTGGRVLHHLEKNLENPNSHIVFVGYQVQGTLGRKLVDRYSPVRVMGNQLEVKAKIHTIGGLSAHADQRDLRYWLRSFGVAPKKVFLVHGESGVLTAFEENIKKELNLNAYVPEPNETVELL
ncbi:MBL fold metallo-hydrolase [Candidatus Dojkabacteria bacterium]|nr:MBL fold metallo-hydrolase [Candidatus Dojkabacteria bacterium]